jgi:hypothetical protein
VIDARERELQQRQRDEKKEKKDRGEFADGGPKFKIETSNDGLPGSGFRTPSGFGNSNGLDTPGRLPGRASDPAGLRSQ